MGTDTEAELVQIWLCEPERFKLYEAAKATCDSPNRANWLIKAEPILITLRDKSWRALEETGWFRSESKEQDVLIMLFALWAYHDL